jgi:hypothetical protein
MKRRVIDLRGDERPLLDVASYAQAGRAPSKSQRLHIELTVRKAPEVVIKVSGGARTLRGVGMHFAYIGREGNLGVELDTGITLAGKDFRRALVENWDLDIEALPGQSATRIRGRKPLKLVHNIVFSMPPGTSPSRVMQAVRKLAVNEWALKHRYAMALHTDDDHPHVHVVVKAVSEQGVRLNIRKEDPRAWRSRFASHLRELGVDANATERAVRGRSRTGKTDGIYRAAQRRASTHILQRLAQVRKEIRAGAVLAEPGQDRVRETRNRVKEGWRRVGAILEANGDYGLAAEVRAFESEIPEGKTEKEMVVENLVKQSPRRTAQPPPVR